jgi:hypothetical protein
MDKPAPDIGQEGDPGPLKDRANEFDLEVAVIGLERPLLIRAANRSYAYEDSSRND